MIDLLNELDSIQEARHKTAEFPVKFHRHKTVEFHRKLHRKLHRKFHSHQTMEYPVEFNGHQTMEYPVEFHTQRGMPEDYCKRYAQKRRALEVICHHYQRQYQSDKHGHSLQANKQTRWKNSCWWADRIYEVMKDKFIFIIFNIAKDKAHRERRDMNGQTNFY